MNQQKHKKSLHILFTLNGIFVFSSTLLGPLYAIFTERIDSRVIFVSATWGIYMLSTTIFTWIVSKFGDKVKETELLLAGGYLVRGVIWLLFPFIENSLQLIFAQIILGIGEALGTPAYDTLLSSHIDRKHAMQWYSDWKILSSLINVVAIFLGGILVDQLGFGYLFPLMGTLALISFFGILIQPRKLL